jgi:hypothetical protein
MRLYSSYLLLTLSFFALAFIAGCKENYPTYSTFCNDKDMLAPKCLHYAVLNKEDKKRLEKSLGMLDDATCAYRVELTKYRVGSCNNAVVKSLGGDFNGYVRIEVKKGFKCYYKTQSDYKNDEDGAFERVLEKAKIDLNQEKTSN